MRGGEAKAALTAEAVRALGRRAFPAEGNLVNVAEIRAMVDRAEEEAGRIDILVNNAGINITQFAVDVTEQAWDTVLDVNLKAVFFCSQAVGRHMIGRKSGKIINVSSQTGTVAIPRRAAYCASKGGVINMTRALALELIPFGIRVNCLSPGITNTPMCQIEAEMAPDPDAVWEAWKSWAPIGRWAEPMEQARAVLFLMRDATFCVGSVLVSDGGYTAI